MDETDPMEYDYHDEDDPVLPFSPPTLAQGSPVGSPAGSFTAAQEAEYPLGDSASAMLSYPSTPGSPDAARNRSKEHLLPTALTPHADPGATYRTVTSNFDQSLFSTQYSSPSKRRYNASSDVDIGTQIKAGRADDLERQVHKLNASRSQLEADRASMERILAKKNKEVAALKSQESMATEKARLAEVRSAAQNRQQIATLEAALAREEQAKSAADGLNEQLKSSAKAQRKELELSQKEAQRWSSKHATLLREGGAMKEEVEKLNRELVRERSRTGALESTRLKLEYHDTEMLQEVADLQAQLSLVQRGREEVEKTLDRAKDRLRKVEEGSLELTAERDRLQLELSSVAQRGRAGESKVQTLQDEKDALLDELAAAKKMATTGEEELLQETRLRRAAEDRAAAAKRDLDRAVQLRVEATEARDAVQFAFENYRREQEAQADSSRTANRALADENEAQSADVQRLRDTLGKLEAEAHRNTEDKIACDRQCQALSRDLDALRKECTLKDERLLDVSREYTHLESTHNDLVAASERAHREQLSKVLDRETAAAASAARADALAKEVESLQKTVAQLDADAAAARAAKATMQQRAAEEGSAHLSAETELRAGIHRLQIDLESAGGEQNRLRGELARMEHRCDDLRAEVEKLDAEVIQRDRDVAEHRHGAGLLQSENTRLVEEVDALSVRLACAQEEADRLAEQLRVAEGRRSHAGAELSAVKRDAETAQLAAEAADRRLEVSRTEAARLVQELRKAKRERDDCVAELDDIRMQHTAMVRRVEATDTALSEAKATAAQKTADVAQATQRLKQEADALRERTLEVEALQRLVNELQDRLRVAQEGNEAAELRHTRALAEAGDKQLALEAELAALKGEAAERGGEVRALQQRLEGARSVEAEMRAAASAAREREAAARADLAQHKMEHERVVVLLREDVADREQHLERLRAATVEHQRALDVMTAQRDDEAARHAAALHEKESILASLRRTEASADEMAGELRVVTSSNRTATTNHEASKAQNERLTKDVARLKDQRATLRQQATSLQEENHALKARLDRVDGHTSYSRLLKEAESLRAALEASEKARAVLEREHHRDIDARPAITATASVPAEYVGAIAAAAASAEVGTAAAAAVMPAAPGPTAAAASMTNIRASHRTTTMTTTLLPPTPAIPTPLAEKMIAVRTAAAVPESAESIVRHILGRS